MGNGEHLKVIGIIAGFASGASFAIQYCIPDAYKPVATSVAGVLFVVALAALAVAVIIGWVCPPATICKPRSLKGIAAEEMRNAVSKTDSINTDTGFVDLPKLVSGLSQLQVSDIARHATIVQSALIQLANLIATGPGRISRIVATESPDNVQFATSLNTLTLVPIDIVDLANRSHGQEQLLSGTDVAIVESTLVTVDRLRKLVEYLERTVGARVRIVLILFDVSGSSALTPRLQRWLYLWGCRVWRCRVVVAFSHSVGDRWKHATRDLKGGEQGCS